MRELQVELPASGALSASGSVLVEDSRLVLGGTPGSANVKLEGEPLRLHEAARNFALALPLEVTLRSLDASIAGFDKSPDQWVASLSAEAGDAAYEDWQAESLKLSAAMKDGGAEITWNLAALDATASGEGMVTWRNLAAGDWMDFSAAAKLDKAKPTIFACNGAECWKSFKASKAAVALGFQKVYWLRGGLPEWDAKGLPVETVD